MTENQAAVEAFRRKIKNKLRDCMELHAASKGGTYEAGFSHALMAAYTIVCKTPGLDTEACEASR